MISTWRMHAREPRLIIHVDANPDIVAKVELAPCGASVTKLFVTANRQRLRVTEMLEHLLEGLPIFGRHLQVSVNLGADGSPAVSEDLWQLLSLTMTGRTKMPQVKTTAAKTTFHLRIGSFDRLDLVPALSGLSGAEPDSRIAAQKVRPPTRPNKPASPMVRTYSIQPNSVGAPLTIVGVPLVDALRAPIMEINARIPMGIAATTKPPRVQAAIPASDRIRRTRRKSGRPSSREWVTATMNVVFVSVRICETTTILKGSSIRARNGMTNAAVAANAASTAAPNMCIRC